MTSQTTKIKNGAIALPKELRESWKGAEIYISERKDSLFIKRLQPSSLSQLRPKLKELGKRVSKQDIKDAIREVRSKGN